MEILFPGRKTPLPLAASQGGLTQPERKRCSQNRCFKRRGVSGNAWRSGGAGHQHDAMPIDRGITECAGDCMETKTEVPLMEPPLLSGKHRTTMHGASIPESHDTVGLFSRWASLWGIEHLAPELPVNRSKMPFLRAFPAFWHCFPRL